MDNPRTNCLVQISPGGPDPLRLYCLVPLPLRKGVHGVIHIYAEGGTHPYFFSNVRGFVPGMNPIVPSNGMIVGYPTEIGTFEITVQVMDADGAVDVRTFSIPVVSKLILGAGTPVIGEYNLPYEYQFRVHGATGSVVWEVISTEQPPPGLTLNSRGFLQGTPTDEDGGTSYFTVMATETNSGDYIQFTCSVEIAPKLTWVPRDGSGNVQILEPYIVGRTLSRPLRPLWTGGVPPYRILPSEGLTPQVLPLGGEIVRLRNYAGMWAYRCNPTEIAGAAPGRFWVEDALGARAEILFGAMATTDSGFLKATKTGEAALVTEPTIEFAGDLVSKVEKNNGGVRVTFAMPQTPNVDSVKVNGKQVVGPQNTGWGTYTGLANKGSWTLYLSPGTIPNTYNSTVAAQLTEALAHIQVLSQRLAAIQGALMTHGLIGP